MPINRLKTLERWQGCRIKQSKLDMFAHQATRALSYKVTYYDPVTKFTGIPWYVIAALDMREENFNHNGYLGNGDLLWKKTTHVPKGRGPFTTWFEGAIDALKYDKMDKIPAGSHWDIVTALIKCEGYNGLGYFNRGLPSPYIWAGTSVQVPGKFTSDGHFDPNALDSQPGVAGLLLSLKSQGVDLNES